MCGYCSQCSWWSYQAEPHQTISPGRRSKQLRGSRGVEQSLGKQSLSILTEPGLFLQASGKRRKTRLPQSKELACHCNLQACKTPGRGGCFLLFYKVEKDEYVTDLPLHRGPLAPQNWWLFNQRLSRRILRHVKLLPGQAMASEEPARGEVWPNASRGEWCPGRSGCSDFGGGVHSVSGCSPGGTGGYLHHFSGSSSRSRFWLERGSLPIPGSPCAALFPFVGCRDLHLSDRSAPRFATLVVARGVGAAGCFAHAGCRSRPRPPLRLLPPLSPAACWAVGKNRSLLVLEGGRTHTGFWISREHCLPSPRNTAHAGPMQTARSGAST